MSNETACFYTVSELEGKLRYDGRVTHRSDRVGIDWTIPDSPSGRTAGER